MTVLKGQKVQSTFTVLGSFLSPCSIASQGLFRVHTPIQITEWYMITVYEYMYMITSGEYKIRIMSNRRVTLLLLLL